MAKDNWAAPGLFLAKNVGKAVIRQYMDAGLSFEDALPVWYLMFPWMLDYYEEQNNLSWPNLSGLRERFYPTEKRRMVMLTIKRQMSVKHLAEKLATQRRVITLDEAIEMGANVPDVETMQFMYVSELSNSGGHVGGKIGITAKPYFRSSQNDYVETRRSKLLVRKEYSLLVELVPVEQTARKVEKRGITRCVKRFGSPISGNECFSGPIDEMKAEVMAAVCEEGLPCVFVHEQWNSLFVKSKASRDYIQSLITCAEEE